MDLTALCSKGPPAKKTRFFNIAAKTAVFAVLRSTPSRQRNRAARAKLSTAFGTKIREVLSKKLDDRKRALKRLIVELAVARVSNSGSISQIRDAFRPQISGPRRLGLHRCSEGYRGRAPKLLVGAQGRWFPSAQSVADN